MMSYRIGMKGVPKILPHAMAGWGGGGGGGQIF